MEEPQRSQTAHVGKEGHKGHKDESPAKDNDAGFIPLLHYSFTPLLPHSVPYKRWEGDTPAQRGYVIVMKLR
jgi:hypothetical protein